MGSGPQLTTQTLKILCTLMNNSPEALRTPEPIRLLIAHSYPVLRDGLRCLLEQNGDHKVIGEASDGAEAVTLARQLKPDILLLYPRLPKQSGWEALRELRTPANATSVRVILLEAINEKSSIMEAFQLGARGFVLMNSATQVLLKAIQTVMAGEYWVLRESLSNLENLQALMQLAHEEERQKKFRLTPRELDILSAVGEGYSNKEMAEYFEIAEETVKHHLSNISDKLGVSSRLELTLFAVRTEVDN